MSEVKSLMFVFDRMPDQDGCTFIEVENAEGHSVCAGEWRDRDDGLVELVVPVNYDEAQRLRADTAEARVKTAEHDLEFFKAGKNEQFDRAEAAEQRIADHESMLCHFASCADLFQVGTMAMDYVAALKPNPEAESHE